MHYVNEYTTIAFVLGAIVGYWYRPHATWRRPRD